MSESTEIEVGGNATPKAQGEPQRGGVFGETPCSLWRQDYEERDGKLEPVKTPDLFVWACVNTKTGEVDMEVQEFEDQCNEELVEGWEWRKFRLIEANATRAGVEPETAEDQKPI